MSDERKSIFEGLDDLDWDAALDDWEKNTLVPEDAQGADAHGTSSPPGAEAEGASRPSAPPVVRGGLDQLFSRAPAARSTSTSDLARPNMTTTAPPEPEPWQDPVSVPPSPSAPSFGDSENEATLVWAGPLPAEHVRELGALPRARPPADMPASDDEDADRPTARVSRASAEAPTVSTRDVEATAREVDAAERIASPRFDGDDDESATVVRDRDSLSDAETATRLPADDEMPTIDRPSSASALADASTTPPRGEPAPFGGDVPAPGWLEADKTAACAARIAWLEEEARALTDEVARGRALLALSELCALVDDAERARAFATEARDVAPSLPLAWRQARQLQPRDPHLLIEALDAEAARSPTPSSRAHAALLAADLLRIHGRGDAAVERWDRARKLDPADARAPIARAALALAQNDHTSGALRLTDNSELAPFDKAVATALRLRGASRADAVTDDMPINDGLRRARRALGSGDVVAAARAAGEIARAPALSKGARWLSAAFGAAHVASRRAAARALKTLADDGDLLARRQLVARGVELGDPELVSAGLSDGAAFDPVERAVLAVLAASEPVHVTIAPDTFARLEDDERLRPLVDALAALAPPRRADEDLAAVRARAGRASGDDEARAQTTLGRLLAASASTSALDEALARSPAPRPASVAGVALEVAVRARRWSELSETLSRLTSSDGAIGAPPRHIAAAILAERAGDHDRAKRAWGEAVRDAATATDGLLRIAADLDHDLDLGAGLVRIADEVPDGVASAVLRLEALARGAPSEAEQITLLERVHQSAPDLGIGAFLAERIGRRRGDLDEVLRWIQERRGYATDPLEVALDAVREALLVADRDPDVAASRLEEAHRSRPDDVALRVLYERLATEPLTDRGAWREARALATTGIAAARHWLEAALEHDRASDAEATRRAAEKAAAHGDRGLSHVLIERAAIETGDVAEAIEALEEAATTAEDEGARREALERLAYLDVYGRKDVAAALARHRSILDAAPRYARSLRWVEHALISEGREGELAPIFEQIALALDGGSGGETTAHAQHAARLHARAAAAAADGPSPWERTGAMVRLAATQPQPSLWALRGLNAHARVQQNDEALLQTTLALLERTQRPPERAALLLRASEAAARLHRVADARAYLEQAANEDPGDIVTWSSLAELREQAGEAREEAEAFESLARTSVVPEHQLLAWHDAATIWLDEVKDPERAMAALEAAAEIDVTYADVFSRLAALYADKALDAELARLLEKRRDVVEDGDERVAIEVELARVYTDMGELTKAKAYLEGALERRPDHTAALGAMADLCIKEGDWSGAEQAYVRLARLLPDPGDQRTMYERLGEIYSVHAPNLSRAEVAFKEVLRRAPGDVDVLVKLVDVYKRQGDAPRATEAQQQIVAASTDPDARLAALLELAELHEVLGRDPRRSEQVLDAARKERPTSVVVLRAMAGLYARQRQLPAMQILLDRAAGDARRAFAQGRFDPSLFQMLHAAFELREKRGAARVVAATLAAVLGRPSALRGADAHAVDPRLDDVLAPDVMSPALRALLFRAGDALDAVLPLDLRALKAAPLQPGTPLSATVGSVATIIGLGALQVFVSPVLGRVAIPLATTPPALVVGEDLAKVENERARTFIVVRAMKMILARASALVRGQPQDVAWLVAGLVATFNPSHAPPGFDARRVADLARRIGPALPRGVDPTVGVIALEAAGMLGARWSSVGPAAHTWADRTALLAVGDPSAALDAIAWSRGESAAPTGPDERAAWIARSPEARELLTFSVTDAYAEARARLGLDR